MRQSVSRVAVLLLSSVALAFAAFVGRVSAAPTSSPAASAPADQDWFQFSGPNRNNVNDGPKLAATWPAEGPKKLWGIKCNTGHSGPVVRDGVLVFMDRLDKKENADAEDVIHGLDAKTGKEIWSRSFPDTWKAPKSYTWGPAASPAAAKGKVICLSCDGQLRCLELATGKDVWAKDLAKDFSYPKGEWGAYASPLIVGDLVILQICQGAAGLIAYNIADGKEVWKTERFPDYGCAPAFMMQGDVPVVIALATGKSAAMKDGDLAGFDARDGSLLWQVKTGKNYYNEPSPTPGDGQVFVEGGGGDGPTVGVKLPESGKGAATVAWKSEDKYLVRFSGYLYYNKLLFGQGYGGHTGVGATKFFCLDPADGKPLWDRPAKETQQWLTASDGKVFHLHENGELAMFDANAREGYKELARAKVIDKTWSQPALCHGRIFIRSDTQIICLDLTGQ